MTEGRNVFVFSREYPPVTVGGTSTVARNLSVGLAHHGWQVTVISASADGEDDVHETIDEVSVHRVGTGTVYNQDTGLSDASVRTHRKLLRAATRLAETGGRPDIVAMPDLFCYPETALFARQQETPIVNILLQDFHTLTLHDRDRHRVSTGVSADRDHLLALEKNSLHGSDHVAFISHALADAVLSHYPGLDTPTSVEYLGVDPEEIAAVARDDTGRSRLSVSLPASAHGMPLLVACGRLVPVKGFLPLIEAAALLRRAGHPVHVAIVGVGPEEDRLRTLADELGIARHVTFLGDIPRREALTWMSLATVAVVPSLWESFCYVCAEMMSLGVPVVASMVDSLNELMPSEEFGYRVPVTIDGGKRTIAPELLAQAIGAALDDPAEAGRRSAAARDRILGQFGNDAFAARMAGLCGRLAAGKTRA